MGFWYDDEVGPRVQSGGCEEDPRILGTPDREPQMIEWVLACLGLRGLTAEGAASGMELPRRHRAAVDACLRRSASFGVEVDARLAKSMAGRSEDEVGRSRGSGPRQGPACEPEILEAVFTAAAGILSEAGYAFEAQRLRDPRARNRFVQAHSQGRLWGPWDADFPVRWRSALGPLAPSAMWAEVWGAGIGTGQALRDCEDLGRGPHFEGLIGPGDLGGFPSDGEGLGVGPGSERPGGPARYLGVVGSRVLTSAGRRIAEVAGRSVIAAGFGLVSGGAEGADRIAMGAAAAMRDALRRNPGLRNAESREFGGGSARAAASPDVSPDGSPAASPAVGPAVGPVVSPSVSSAARPVAAKSTAAGDWGPPLIEILAGGVAAKVDREGRIQRNRSQIRGPGSSSRADRPWDEAGQMHPRALRETGVDPHGGSDAAMRSAVRRVSLAPPGASFTPGLAMERNQLIYAAAEAVLVVEPRFRVGGSWQGAVEALRKRRTLVWVAGDPDSEAVRALIALGASHLAAGADFGAEARRRLEALGLGDPSSPSQIEKRPSNRRARSGTSGRPLTEPRPWAGSPEGVLPFEPAKDGSLRF